MWSKKGVEAERVLVFLIMLLVTVVLVIYFLGGYYFGAAEVAEKALCKDSVKAYVDSFGYLEERDPTEIIQCPTRYVKLSGSDVKRKMADEMYNCWDSFGQGKYVMFKEEQIYCHVCSVIDLDAPNGVDGFSKYLMEATIPGKDDVTYYSFLNAYEDTDARTTVEELSPDDQKKLESEQIPDGEYSVIFIYAKGAAKVRQLSEAFDSFIDSPADNFLIAGGVMLIGTGLIADITIIGTVVGVPLKIMGGLSIAAGTVWGAIEAYWGAKSTADIHSSMVVFRKYSPDEIKNLGCEYLPIESLE